jgi:hypothetical protein
MVWMRTTSEAVIKTKEMPEVKVAVAPFIDALHFNE